VRRPQASPRAATRGLAATAGAARRFDLRATVLSRGPLPRPALTSLPRPGACARCAVPPFFDLLQTEDVERGAIDHLSRTPRAFLGRALGGVLLGARSWGALLGTLWHFWGALWPSVALWGTLGHSGALWGAQPGAAIAVQIQSWRSKRDLKSCSAMSRAPPHTSHGWPPLSVGSRPDAGADHGVRVSPTRRDA
jgi:hypothetical protein